MATLNTLKQELEKLQLPIYISGHITPDNDSIGSSIALGRLLEKIGKEVFVLLEDYDQDILDVHKNRHLVTNAISHTDYAFIALDLNEEYRLGRWETNFQSAKVKINIDHHQGNNTTADLIISQPEKSSTCEIIYNLYSEFDQNYLDTEICESLYAGMMTDTGCFARRLSTETLTIAQDLINHGINYEDIIRRTYSHRTLYELQALSMLVNNLQFDSFHYVVMDKTLPEFCSLTHNQIMKTIAEEIRKIEGIDVFILLIKDQDSLTAKCMSNISKNANIIAELFGGGGHKGEAGFTTTEYTIDEIISSVKDFLTNEKN
ncbi:MAG: DHH family phosphoesterase [Clostridia bacterium]|nr:DHH family phosphoesterase [Clostridia bacterium]